MTSKAELRPGGTYMLDDFTIIHVVAVSDREVRYRIRAWTWSWHRRVVTRRTRPSSLKKQIRAEVNGDFFPAIALPTHQGFRHPDHESRALAAYLAERAKSRPFA